MKAVVCEQGDLSVREVADPRPGPGQVLLEVVRCGICGSDLHARHHADDVADAAAAIGFPDIMRRDQAVVMGHEFSGRVLELRPGHQARLADRRTRGGAADAAPGRPRCR